MDRQKALNNFSCGFKSLLSRLDTKSRAIAKRLDVSEAMTSKMKKGTALPSFETLCDLIGLGMRLDEIFGEELAEKLSQDFHKNMVIENPSKANDQALQFLSYLNEKIKEFKTV